MRHILERVNLSVPFLFLHKRHLPLEHVLSRHLALKRKGVSFFRSEECLDSYLVLEDSVIQVVTSGTLLSLFSLCFAKGFLCLFWYLVNFANCTVWALKPRTHRWDFNILRMTCSSRADSSFGKFILKVNL